MTGPGSATRGPDPQLQAAAALRRERLDWVVIWVARKNQFQGRPLFPAPAGIVAAGATTGELAAEMDRITTRPRRTAPTRRTPGRPQETP
jgi:hypothetical protein